MDNLRLKPLWILIGWLTLAASTWTLALEPGSSLPPLARRAPRWWRSSGRRTSKEWAQRELGSSPTSLLCPTWKNAWWGWGIHLYSSSSLHPATPSSSVNACGAATSLGWWATDWEIHTQRSTRRRMYDDVQVEQNHYLESNLVTLVEKNSSTPSSTLPMRPFCCPSWHWALLICWKRELKVGNKIWSSNYFHIWIVAVLYVGVQIFFPSIILFIIRNYIYLAICLSIFHPSFLLLLTDTLVDCVFLLRRGRSLVKCWSFFSSSDGSSASVPFGWCCWVCWCDGVGGVREEVSSTWTGTSSRALSRSNSISVVVKHTKFSLTRLFESNAGGESFLPKARETGRSILLWMLFRLDLGVIWNRSRDV